MSHDDDIAAPGERGKAYELLIAGYDGKPTKSILSSDDPAEIVKAMHQGHAWIVMHRRQSLDVAKFLAQYRTST